LSAASAVRRVGEAHDRAYGEMRVEEGIRCEAIAGLRFDEDERRARHEALETEDAVDRAEQLALGQPRPAGDIDAAFDAPGEGDLRQEKVAHAQPACDAHSVAELLTLRALDADELRAAEHDARRHAQGEVVRAAMQQPNAHRDRQLPAEREL